MSRVNPESFRLGISKFWKSELFSSIFSSFIRKFLAVYVLLKKRLSLFFFKIITFKFLFLKRNKILILANVYRLYKRVSYRRYFKRKLATNKFQRDFASFFNNSRYDNRAGIGFRFNLKKTRLMFESEDPGILFRREKSFLRNVVFFLDRVSLVGFSFFLERILFRLLLFPISIKLRNVFEKKVNILGSRIKKQSSNYLIKISREIFIKVAQGYTLQYFKYVKDAVNILNLAFFFHKSELISNYVAEIIQLRNRKFFHEVINIKKLIPYFSKYYFNPTQLELIDIGLKICILGKMRGQKARKFRRLVFQQGSGFSTQDVSTNLSYNLAQTWNIFGSFGVKVWMFKRWRR